LFLVLSIGSVAVALFFLCFTFWRAQVDPHAPTRVRLVLVLLILLNARQNLRQYRFAGILKKRGLS
jgi:hypothetical protein